jgi:RsiW-degrading membrane proteinase PrsW (M82 family)/RNA polymerase subunit RPABC4/transcription elongation factor Spt4
VSDDSRSSPEMTLVECPHCKQLVPSAPFCGDCGARLMETGDRGRGRVSAYAAAPHEPVLRPSVITTLFPHLPHRHTHLFRDLLVAGIAIVGILCAFRLFSSATIAAALILPILYILYLYEAEIYEREPVLVIGATFVAGAALAVGYTLVTAHFLRPSFSPAIRDVLLYGVIYPLIAQLLMIAGPLLLLGRKHFDETLDGLTFGAASGLGFTMAAIIAGYWHTLTTTLITSGPAVDEVLRLLRLGVFGALVNASTTALITSSLWLRRSGRSRGWHGAMWRDLPAAIALAFLLQIALGVLTTVVNDLLAVVVIWGIGAAVSLVLLRIVVHHALLDEGAEHQIGEPTACPECHRLVPTMLFCPNCGVARSAAPKRRGTETQGAPDAASAGAAG